MPRAGVGKTKFLVECVFLAFLICTLGIRFFADKWSFWLPLINGATWPSEWEDEYADFPMWFSFVLALRFLLNISPIFVVILLVWEVFFAKPEKIMKVLDLLNIRDGMAASVVAQILNLSDEDDEKVRAAIAQSAKIWSEKHLPAILGKKEAQEFVSHSFDEDHHSR